MKQKIMVIPALVALIALTAFSSYTEEWTLLAEDGGVKAYYQLGSCDSRNVMFLKFENTLNTSAKVDFNMILENNPPSPQIIELKANEIISGQCIGTPDLLKDVMSASPSPQVSMKLVN